MSQLFTACVLFLLAAPAQAGKKKEAEATPAPPAATAPAAPIAPTPADAWAYRKVVFKGIAMHLKAATMMARGRVETRMSDLLAHADGLNELGRLIPDLFPAGTGPEVNPESEALPAVWSDPAGFAAKAAAFQAETARLVSIAQQGEVDAYKAQVGRVNKACDACHDGYRKPKEEGDPVNELDR